MRIGVVSDTHNHLRNVRRIVDLFNAAAVDRVVHAARRFEIRLADPPLSISWAERRLLVVHDPHAVGVLDLSSLEAEWLRF